MVANDYFSTQAKIYSVFRPRYPESLFDFYETLVPDQLYALDLGCGNGQLLVHLKSRFSKVVAIDSSRSQLSQARPSKNILYLQADSARLPVQSGNISLALAAQSVHWFDFALFFSEIERVLKIGGIFSMIGYGLPKIDSEIDRVIYRFYSKELEGFWPPERKHIDSEYRNIHFNYRDIPCPVKEISTEWQFDDLVGFLKSWSAVNLFIKNTGNDPVIKIQSDLSAAWGNTGIKKTIRWPLFVRSGRKESSQ